MSEVDDAYADTPETDNSIKWVKRPTNTRALRSSHEYKVAHDQYRKECANRPQPDGTIGDPCIRDGEPINYCVHPDTLVLCADLVWRRAAKLMLDEEIIAFDEHVPEPGLSRKFRRATIEAKTRLKAACVEITTDDGTSVVCSLEHRWLILSGNTLRWKSAGKLGIGDTLLTIGRPWVEGQGRESGYLAGIFDGEGYVGLSRQVGFSQLPGAVLDRATAALKALEINYRAYGRSKDGVVTVAVIGGVWHAVRCLGFVRPVRLLPKAHRLWEGSAVNRGGACKTRITSITALGNRHVIGLQTSAATFIANGLLSHNSLQYPHPQSWSLEHLIPVSKRPDLLMDRNNWASAHFACNSAAGPNEMESDLGIPSESW